MISNYNDVDYLSIFAYFNNDLGTLSFDQDESGKWGYKVGGADPVIPFKNLYTDTPGTATAADITIGITAWVNGELITGIRPVPISQQSGTISAYLGVGSVVSDTVIFSSPFESVPKIDTTRLSNGDGCNGYYCDIYIIFQL